MAPPFAMMLLAAFVLAEEPAPSGDLAYRAVTPGDQRVGPFAEPFAFDAGTPLPDELLIQLTEQSERYRTLLEQFACSETDDGRQRVDYLLRFDDADPLTVEELRFRGDEPVKSHHRSVPPPASWGLLFSERSRPYFLYRYLGVSVAGFNAAHRIAFRGGVPFSKDADIRSWEGVVTVGVDSLDLLNVEAAPRLYAETLGLRTDRWRRSFKFSIGLLSMRRRKTPADLGITVEFGGHARGSLPTSMSLLRRKVTKDGLATEDLGAVRYDDYRFFETRAVDRIGRLAE